MNPPRNKPIWSVEVDLVREGGDTMPERGPGQPYDKAAKEVVFWATRHKFKARVVLLPNWEELIAAKQRGRR